MSTGIHNCLGDTYGERGLGQALECLPVSLERTAGARNVFNSVLTTPRTITDQFLFMISLTEATLVSLILKEYTDSPPPHICAGPDNWKVYWYGQAFEYPTVCHTSVLTVMARMRAAGYFMYYPPSVPLASFRNASEAQKVGIRAPLGGRTVIPIDITGAIEKPAGILTIGSRPDFPRSRSITSAAPDRLRLRLLFLDPMAYGCHRKRSSPDGTAPLFHDCMIAKLSRESHSNSASPPFSSECSNSLFLKWHM